MELQIQPWVEEISLEMLPEPYRKLSGKIGIESVLKIAELFQGTSVYFPKLDATLKSIRNIKIHEEFDGGNITDLAIKFNLTEVWVRQILSDIVPDEDQLTLF